MDSGCSDNRESKRIRLEEDANANERPDRPDSATDVQISESLLNVHEFIEEKNARFVSMFIIPFFNRVPAISDEKRRWLSSDN